MNFRKLGTSDMELSTLGLGTWAIGGWMWGSQDDKDSIAAVLAALDAGINWIDTAPIYGSGRSEKVVGEALRQLGKRQRPFVFTKYGLGDNSATPVKSATRADVQRECNASLKRLGVERIDLYQLHWPAPQPLQETARACEELLKAGKIRAIGVSNFDLGLLEGWKETGVPLHSLQSPYSVFRPEVAKTIIPWCAKHNVGVIAYSPLFRGMLFGTWTAAKRFPADDTRGTHKDYSGPRFKRHLEAIDDLRKIADAAGTTVPELAIGALFAESPGLTGAIVGARNAAQGAALARMRRQATEIQLKQIREIIARLQGDLAQL